jgi:beta-mannanase
MLACGHHGADADEMPAPARTLLVTSAIVLALVVAMTGRSSTAKSAIAGGREGASTARGANVDGRALFGLNVPSLQALDESESALRARPAIIGTFADWKHAPDFPIAVAEAINDRGAVPLISWEPWDWDGGTEQPAYALRRILAGAHDALIDRWATQVAAHGRPVLLRFAPEMNGDWRPWSIGLNGNRADEYVATWRHVRERFARAGAANAIWVWNPIIAYDGSTPLSELFPGADEVDWLAVDGYNWGSTRAWGWQSYADIFAPTLNALHKLAPRRPLMIAETGSAPGRRKASWVTDTLTSARADGVDAVVWFEFSKETDWRLSESPAVAKAARTVVSHRAWRQGGDLAAVERAVNPRRSLGRDVSVAPP